MNTVRDEIEKLQKMNPDEVICSPLWQIDDVIFRAKDSGYEFTEEEAESVLHGMSNKHDCEIGINWIVMDFWIDEVVREREEK